MRETVNIGGREFPVVGAARRNDASHLAPAASKPKRNKYNAQSVVVDGVRFASKAEAERDAELLILLRAGKIRNLVRQPKFDLKVAGILICRYRGDWRYWEMVEQTPEGQRFIDVVEDRKGAITPAFKIKWALARALFPDIEWRLS